MDIMCSYLTYRRDHAYGVMLRGIECGPQTQFYRAPKATNAHYIHEGYHHFKTQRVRPEDCAV